MKILVGFLMVVAIVMALLAAPVVREYTKPIPPPENPYTTTTLMFLARPEGQSDLAMKMPENAQTTESRPLARSRESADDTSSVLKFRPYIQDLPEIPPELKARAKEINAKFEQVYLRVAAYERRKADLKPGEAIKELERIIRENQQAEQEIWNAAHGMLTHEASEALEKRNREFSCWFHAAGLEAYSRAENWHACGSFAEGSRRLNSSQWMEEEYARNGGRPVFGADYDRRNNFRDLNRVLYYYRRQGGFNGFMNTADFYYTRKWEAWQERKNGGWSPGVKIKVVKVQGRK